MAFSIDSNVGSPLPLASTSRTSAALSKTLERLTSGLKSLRSTETALPLTEQARAHMSDLRTSIDKTSQSVYDVQAAERGLSSINDLLAKARGLAVDSANNGLVDPDSLAENQAEIEALVTAIDDIASGTSSGTKKLLDGSATLTNPSAAGTDPDATLPLASVAAKDLGTGVEGNEFGSLADIDVTTDATDALAIIDKSIETVNAMRGRLGEFQSNVLRSNANYLQVSLENKLAAQSLVRDTNFAAEMAQFTKNQVMVQAGTTVLSGAKHSTQLIAGLLLK